MNHRNLMKKISITLVLGLILIAFFNQNKLLKISNEVPNEEKTQINISSIPEVDTLLPVNEGTPAIIKDMTKAINAPALIKSNGNRDNWTILVYMAGDNDLETFALIDFNEIESIDFNNKGINVIVQFDRADGYDTSEGDWTGTHLYEVVPDSNTNQIGSNLLIDLGELNMGNGSVLTEFINYSLSHYPAENVALILWDHGGGLDGIALDEASRHDSLSVLEIKQAISVAQEQLKDKGFNHSINILGFDACLMGTIEIAYELKDLTDYMVSSEEIEPGDGWPYDLIMQDLAINPNMTPKQLSMIIVDRYAEFYRGKDHFVTQSAVDLKRISEFTKKIDLLATSLTIEVNDEPISGNYPNTYILNRALNMTQTYRSSGMIDLGDFVEKIESLSTNPSIDVLAQNVTEALTQIIINEKHGPQREGSTGLTVHFPKSGKVYDTNFKFKLDTGWDELVQAFQSQFKSPGYKNWVTNQNIPVKEGIDVGIFFEIDNYFPDNGTSITLTWVVFNIGLYDVNDIVVFFYEAPENARADPSLIGYYEISYVGTDSYVFADLIWQVNVTGWRVISAFVWVINDINPSDNEFLDYIWVVPSQGSPTGTSWLNLTDEGYPYEGYTNYLYFGVQNLGAGEINPWTGNITIFGYSYEQELWYLIANLSFAINGWISGTPPMFEDWVTWIPNSGGWWHILFITYYELDPVHDDDYFSFDVWVIEDQTDLEVIILDYDWPIESIYGEMEILVINYGLTSPGVNAAYTVWAYSDFEASWNDTYDWELIYISYITGLGSWEDTNYFVILAFDWIPDWAGSYRIWVEVYEDWTDPESDNDPIESNNFDFLDLFVFSLSPDLESFLMTFEELTYQSEIENYLYLEIANMGLSDSLAGNVEIFVYDWHLETEEISVIFSGSNGQDIISFGYLSDLISWVPSKSGWHILVMYVEDLVDEYLIDDLNWYYLLVWVEEAPELSDDITSSIWESSEDYLISFYSTDIGDVDNDGDIEVIVVGNLTEITTELEFLGLWIFNYASISNQLILEYETYWSTGAEETLQAVSVENLDTDTIPEIVIAGSYLNESDGLYYSYLAICTYDNSLNILVYNNWVNVWVLSIGISQLDTDVPKELALVGYYWEWNITTLEWDLYAFISILSYDYSSGELNEDYFNYWTEGIDSLLTGIEFADLDYPIQDGIDEIIFSGYFFDISNVYAYIAVYSYNENIPELVLLDYDFYQNAYLLDVSTGEIDQFSGNEIIASGYYVNESNQYIFTLIYYFDTISQSLELQDVFIEEIGENAVISALDLIDVDNDERQEVVIGGYYYNTTMMKWYSFIAIYQYEFGSAAFDGVLNIEYYVKWATSDDYLHDIRAVNLDKDDDIECISVGSANNRGQVSIQTVKNYFTGSITWNANEYSVSDTATITVVDTDLDINPDIIDHTIVQITSNSDPVGITVTLLETGTNTGIFKGTCKFSLTITNDNLDLLKVKEGDVITAKYTDDYNVNKNSVDISQTASIRSTSLTTTPTTTPTTTTGQTNPKSSTFGFHFAFIIIFSSLIFLKKRNQR